MKMRSKNTLWAICIGVVVLLLILVLIVSTLTRHGAQSLGYKQSPASTKSLSQQLTGAQAQDINNNVHREILASAKKIEQDLDNKLDEIKRQQGSTHKSINKAAIQSSIETDLKAQLEQFKNKMSEIYSAKHTSQKTNYSTLSVGGGSQDTHATTSQVQWIDDVSIEKPKEARGTSGTFNPLGNDGFSAFDSGSDSGISSKKREPTFGANGSPKSEPVPFYTITPNSVMTGVIPLQPLIGRIPKGANHSVFQPFSVMFVTEHPTLMAQGHEAPLPVAKMTGTAVCYGDFMSESVTCHVKSLTFIFPDGHYQVIDASDDKGKSSIDDDLGTLANVHGNPQIRGELKTSVGWRIGMRAGTAAIGAYGQGISQAQVQNYGQSAMSTIQRISNANQYALGQGIAGAANGTQDEITQLEQSMFDYVFVPNWNPKTQRLIRLNIIIHRELKIDYDKTARKINYENAINTHTDDIVL